MAASSNLVSALIKGRIFPTVPSGNIENFNFTSISFETPSGYEGNE